MRIEARSCLPVHPSVRSVVLSTRTFRTQGTSDLYNLAPKCLGHFGTSAEVSWCRNFLGPKCIETDRLTLYFLSSVTRQRNCLQSRKSQTEMKFGKDTVTFVNQHNEIKTSVHFSIFDYKSTTKWQQKQGGAAGFWQFASKFSVVLFRGHKSLTGVRAGAPSKK